MIKTWRERLTKPQNSCYDHEIMSVMQAEIDELRAELAAAMKDADRLAALLDGMSASANIMLPTEWHDYMKRRNAALGCGRREGMNDTTISKCPSCGQEMHPTDYVERLRSELAAERTARNALEGDRTELQAKIGGLEQELVRARASCASAAGAATVLEAQLAAAKNDAALTDEQRKKPMTQTGLTPKAEIELEELWRLERRAVELLDIISAEFQSDLMSIQCFDLRIVQESISVSKRLKELTPGWRRKKAEPTPLCERLAP